ncbi:MAG TPA: SIR2 family protein [Alphaproteobacteria bacterium]|nr:SIR2 family protein [Alphaproteobacteria bacterium]
MTRDLHSFIRTISPENTVLLFGAGASIPSGAPSVPQLVTHLSERFKQDARNFSLSEISELIEKRSGDRRTLIAEVRNLYGKILPTGGLLNLPLYNWKSLYTTNYDELIEVVYDRRGKDLQVYSSNYDFTSHTKSGITKLFKIHGTIKKDICDGHKERLILTTTDYDNTEDYRNYLFDRLKSDLAEANLVIIGHSLQDVDVKEIVERAIKLKTQTQSNKQITLLMYTRDDDRAELMEARGVRVVFGGLDEFFTALAALEPAPLFAPATTENLLDNIPSLLPVSIDVSHSIQTGTPNIAAMFNGSPATYPDIKADLTFERSFVSTLVSKLEGSEICFLILGASGVGKTTAARQILSKAIEAGFYAWEHKRDQALQVQDWFDAALLLLEKNESGILLIDDAHQYLYEVNDLVDKLSTLETCPLKIVLTSSKNHWNPRVKTPNIYRKGVEFILSQLDGDEISKLLLLIQHPNIQPLLEHTFSGFSKHEQKRRLVDKCHSDMFVCLKNIFASEKFDDIILREYASLERKYQDVYKFVSALETAGVRVHRQLIVRLLTIPADAITSLLSNMTDIISEYDVDIKEGIYGWRGRHPVITGIVTKYKFSENNDWVSLFEKVIDHISPTYDIEIRSIRELCNIQSGISRISDKKIQNRLLRRMISVAPSERVPRHRLIRNLIDMGEFDHAETEIRIFDKDFSNDGPVSRYKTNLMVARATKTPGLMPEDRMVILNDARFLAQDNLRRFPNNKYVLGSYADVGIEIYRLTGKYETFDDAISNLKEAENQLGDPDISNLIRKYERKIAGQPIDVNEVGE